LAKTIDIDNKVNEELTKSDWKVLRFLDDDILKTPETFKNRPLKQLRNL
jgi:very-short-patch-repair endonuclease